MTDDLRYWLGFNLVPGIGPARFEALQRYFGSLETAWAASGASLRAAGLPRDAVESLQYRRDRLDLVSELRRVQQAGVSLLTLKDELYPPLLREIAQPPPLIYVRGGISSEDRFAVAIVGTRRATVYGTDVAKRLAGGLAENGVTIVSGLALGIDGAAHRAALEAGGRTLAVLGCGLDYVYPSRHRQLARQIGQAGALITNYPMSSKADAANFPPRNRIISGLSLGTIIVEAGERSGALITLRYALDQGRETFCVPGNIFSRASFGTNAALQRGEAKLVTKVQDVLEELNLTMVVEHNEVREAVPETEMESKLLTCLERGQMHIDDLVRDTGIPTAAISSTLMMLELKGLVRRIENMSYTLAR